MELNTLERLGWQLTAKVVTQEPIRKRLIEYAKEHPYWHLEGYMNRYWVFNPFIDGKSELGGIYPDLPSIRIHHILRADGDRHLHNHPWNAVSIILKGWYAERLMDGSLVYRRAGDVNVIRHSDYHRIEQVSEGGVWTLFTTFGYEHPWGFDVDGTFVDRHEYFKMLEQELEQEKEDSLIQRYYELSSGGPNPYYKCVCCSEEHPALREYLINHLLTHGIRTNG